MVHNGQSLAHISHAGYHDGGKMTPLNTHLPARQIDKMAPVCFTKTKNNYTPSFAFYC